MNKVFASLTILSAGGIGSPLILRNSGIKEAGRHFFFDPLIGVRGTVKDLHVPQYEVPMSTGLFIKDEGYLIADMTHPAVISNIFALQAGRPDHLFKRENTLQIIIKAKDDLGGRLSDRGKVIKSLSNYDKQKLKMGYSRAREILRKAGAKHIFKTQYLAAHPGGTVKIGDIVDSNLQTKYNHLYVCDCSVFPEAWGLPPVATIIAQGKRLVKHLS